MQASIGAVDLIIVALYVAAMFGVGVYARTRIKSVDDFLVAGNRFKMFSLVGTLMAALVGAGMTMGVVGGTFTYGSGVMWNYLGFGVGMVVYGLFYVKAVRRTGKRTTAEVIAAEFGRVPRFCVAIVVAFYCIAILALCIMGMGRLLTYLGSSIGLSITVAVIITSLVTIGYTALGGFYSVVWTDVVQFVIMFIVIVIVGPIIAFSNAGSPAIMETAMNANGLSMFNIVEGVPLPYIIASFILVFLGTPGDPTLAQRALAADSDKTAKNSFLISGGLTVIFGAGLVIIGVASFILLPNIKEQMGTNEAAFPIFIMTYFPPVLKGLGLAGLLAAIMSTISAMLLVASTHLVYDAGKALFPNASDDFFKRALPILIVVIGCIVTYLALKVTSLAGVMYIAFSLIGSALFFPTLFTLFWKRATSAGITTGIVSGAVVCAYMYLTSNYGWGGDPVYTAAPVCIILTIIVSLITGKGKIREGWHNRYENNNDSGTEV